jgi:hypothetical protein
VRFNMKKICVALIATVVGGVLSTQATAAALPAGTALFGPSTEGDPVGGTEEISVTIPFTAAGAFSGSLKTTVLSGDTSNPYGGLTFIYELTNDGTAGPNSIGRMSLDGFAPFLIDASYQIPAAGIAPASIDRNPSGDVVGFNFVPLASDPATGFLAPGDSSAVLVLQTDATAYARGTFGSLIDGGVATVDTIVPVPEPSTMVLVLASLAGAAVIARRR